jgi:hypothetical protein
MRRTTQKPMSTEPLAIETPAPKRRRKSLPIKRQKFVEALIGPANGNKTKAAAMAGYSMPESQGSRLSKFVDVAQAVAERLARVQRRMGADEIRARLELMAEGVVPTKIVETETKDGTFARTEFDVRGAAETVAKIDGLIGDGMPPERPAVNLTVVLGSLTDGALTELLTALRSAKAKEINP